MHQTHICFTNIDLSIACTKGLNLAVPGSIPTALRATVHTTQHNTNTGIDPEIRQRGVEMKGLQQLHKDYMNNA